MACCTTNTWTNIIAVLTIIFCIPYIVVHVLLLIISPTITSNEIILKILIYIALEEKPINILLYCSIIFNVLWILSSIILLVYLGNTAKQEYSIKETKKLVKVYVLWIIIGFLTFVVDVGSIIFHSIKYNDYFEVKIFPVGALCMLILSARFGVILAFHIISWIGMIIIMSKVKKSITDDDTKSIGRIVPLKPPKPALKPSKVPYLEHNNVDRVQNWYKHYEADNNNTSNGSNYYMEPNAAQSQYIPRLNGNTNPAFVNNNNYVSPSRPPVPPKRPAPPPPQHHMPGSNTNVLVNGVTSGTLRRQLPWSYMPNGGELPQRQPWKQSSPVPSNGTAFSWNAPYVPAPDYNDRNPTKIQRQELNQPGWSQYL